MAEMGKRLESSRVTRWWGIEIKVVVVGGGPKVSIQLSEISRSDNPINIIYY